MVLQLEGLSEWLLMNDEWRVLYLKLGQTV